MKGMRVIAICLFCVICFSNGAQAQQSSYIYYSAEDGLSRRDIYRMNADGTNRKKLTKHNGRGHYPHYNGPKLSPTGNQIVYHSDPDGHDRYTVWIMDIDGSSPKKLTTKEGLYANWSPDGKTIVFSGRRNGTWEILTVPSEGGEETIISNNFMKRNKPGWGAICGYSSDGKRIVYTYIREQVLYAMELETNTTTQVTPSGEKYTQPSYSPDGSKSAVIKKVGDGYNLILISPDGQLVDSIAKRVISYSNPAWSGDGNELLFCGMVNGNQELFKIDLSTREEVQLTKNSTFDAMPTWR